MYTMCAVSYKRTPARPETRGTQPIGPPQLPVQSPYGQPSARTELSCIKQCIDTYVAVKGTIQPCPQCLTLQFELIGETSMQLPQKWSPCGLEERRGCHRSRVPIQRQLCSFYRPALQGVQRYRNQISTTATRRPSLQAVQGRSSSHALAAPAVCLRAAGPLQLRAWCAVETYPCRRAPDGAPLPLPGLPVAQ